MLLPEYGICYKKGYSCSRAKQRDRLAQMETSASEEEDRLRD